MFGGKTHMQVSANDSETYLFLNGLEVTRPLRLSEYIQLLPAHCSPNPDDIIQVSKSEIALGIAVVFLRGVKSQLRIIANAPQELVARAWNAVWDALLLGAICQCEVMCNLQCDSPAEAFGPKSNLHVTNYHLRGLSGGKIHTVTEDEAVWIEKHIEKARSLMDNSAFQNAVHSLSSYYWHPHPKAQLAVLWSGIEGLFNIESELVFRISLYAARFLAPNDEAERRRVFSEVKRLYKQRSAAVHGSTLKGDSAQAVEDSTRLLLRIMKQCAELNSVPDIDKLAP